MMDCDSQFMPMVAPGGGAGYNDEHYESASVCYGTENNMMQQWDGDQEQHYGNYGPNGMVMFN